MIGFERKFKIIEILTEDEVEVMWDGIYDVLENTGLKFDVQALDQLKVFKNAGCKVDFDTKMVKFPKELVIEYLSLCPNKFRAEARDPKNDIIMGGNRVNIQPGPGMLTVDIDTFNPREATRKEMYNAVTVYDSLPNFHLWHSNAPHSSFEGVPPVMAYVETHAARARNSTKVNRIAQSEGNHIFSMQIAEVEGAKGLAGECANSPLCWGGDVLTAFIDLIKADFPCGFYAGPVWGSSSPVTTAGTLISQCAEIAGPIVMSQILKQGHPVFAATLSLPQNMKSGDSLFGNIQLALGSAGFNQLWRKWGIPTVTSESAIPNSKCMDFQSGFEKGMISLVSAMTGASVVWIHGTVHGELTAHPVQAIMDDDISGMVGRFIEGIKVNDDTMAVELIKEVGAGPDFFLNKAHTRKWWRSEQYVPNIADMLSIPEWIDQGKKTNVDRAKEKMKEILETHKVSIPLSDHQEDQIERILKDATHHYKKSGRI